MKPINSVFLIILTISVQNMNAKILNDSIPAGKNYDKAIFRLWYPDDLNVIKGIVVLMPGSNDDGRRQVSDTVWQATTSLHAGILREYLLSSLTREEFITPHWHRRRRDQCRAFSLQERKIWIPERILSKEFFR